MLQNLECFKVSDTGIVGQGWLTSKVYADIPRSENPKL